MCDIQGLSRSRRNEHISVNSLETLPWAIKKEHEKANEKEIDLSTITERETIDQQQQQQSQYQYMYTGENNIENTTSEVIPSWAKSCCGNILSNEVLGDNITFGGYDNCCCNVG
jgi:hypothetical protein